MLNRSHTHYLLAQFLSAVGDGCFHFGIVQSALLLGSNSESFVGWAQLFRTFPYFIALLIAFRVVDSVRRRYVMQFSDVLRALVLIVMLTLLEVSLLTASIYFALIFIKSLGDVHFNAARDAWITQVQSSDKRARLNSLVQGGYKIGFAVGPLLAWGVYQFDGAIEEWTGLSTLSLILLVDALSYLLSLLLLFGSDNPEVPKTHVSRGMSIAEWKKLFVQVPLLKVFLFMTACNNLFIMGPALVGAPALIQIEMGLDADAFAQYETVFALSIAMSAFFLFRWPPRQYLRVVVIGLILDGLTHVPFVLCDSGDRYSWLIPIAVAHAMCIPLIEVSRTSWIQDHVPQAYQGRIFATMSAMVLGTTGISCALTGFIISRDIGFWKPTQLFFYTGFMAAATGVIVGLAFRRLSRKT